MKDAVPNLTTDQIDYDIDEARLFAGIHHVSSGNLGLIWNKISKLPDSLSGSGPLRIRS